VEEVVRAVEQAPSLEAACADRRPEIELPGLLRSIRRQVHPVHTALSLTKGILPEHFAPCAPTLNAFADCLGTEEVLAALGESPPPILAWLPAPLGFHPRWRPGGEPRHLTQRSGGPDPPACLL
jgi:hypothetical protein